MGRKLLQILTVLVFLCGLGFFLYPKATEWYAVYQNEKVIEEFESNFISVQETAENDSDKENEISNQKLEQLYKDMQEYNQKLYEEGQENLKDPFAYETPSFDLKSYGFKNNVIGTVWIPKMEVKLPIYLGADRQNMTKGAVLLGETSMPAGGENTNVVLAAHRGFKGIPMFREIQLLESGDKIYITTPYETLTYEVTEFKIILPDKVEEVLIQEGKDMITLLTCHPYTKNTHRYLVYAERVTEKPKEDEISEETEVLEKSKISGENEALAEPQKKDSQSEKRIWLETYVPYIGGVFLLILIAAGVILTRKKR